MSGVAEELPDSFHILWIGARNHLIDDGTRRQVEQFLASDPGKCEAITIDAISGEEILVVGYSVSSIESSTPGIRRRDTALRKSMEDEEGYSPS